MPSMSTPGTASPRLTLTAGDPDADAKLRAFAAEHIGDEPTVTIHLVYTGHESAADLLTIDRDGTIIEAVEAPADA